MNRRTLLASAAALMPTGVLEAFARDQNSAPVSPAQPRVVLNGQDRFGEFHSRGNSTMLFKLMPRETNGGLFIIEHEKLVRGGPPLHLHLAQEEWFYVMEGQVAFQVGERRLQLGPGDSALGPRGVPHTFAPVGSSPARMLIAFTPGGKMEEFFRATAIRDPPVQDAAFFRRYEMELLGPSPFAS